MKTLKKCIGVLVITTGLVGCTSAYYASSGYATDDLYATHNKTEIARKKQAEAEAQRAAAEARKAEWEARIAEAQAAAAENNYYEYKASGSSENFQSVLADNYESAYARRLRGFESPTYNMPSSYYNARYGSTFNYVSAYDPAFYNVIVMGDQVWVEPKYVTAMFGTWGRPSIYSNAWYFGWGYTPSYAYWNYPYYGWNSWNWGFGFSWYGSCYDPWWGHNHYYSGCYPGWYGGYGHGHGSHGWGRPYSSNIVHRPNANRSPSGNYYGPGYNRNSGQSSLRGDGNKNNNSYWGVRGNGSSNSNRNNSSSGTRGDRNNYNSNSNYRDSGGNSFNRGGNYDSGGSSFSRGSSSSSYSGGGSSSRGGSGTTSSGGSSRNAGGR